MWVHAVEDKCGRVGTAWRTLRKAPVGSETALTNLVVFNVLEGMTAWQVLDTSGENMWQVEVSAGFEALSKLSVCSSVL